MQSPPSLHPGATSASLALALTFMILLGQDKDQEEAAYEALSTRLQDWQDERKADLYARIVEKLHGKKADWTGIHAQVCNALNENGRIWGYV